MEKSGRIFLANILWICLGSRCRLLGLFHKFILRRIPEVTFYVTDLNRSFSFDFFFGLQESNKKPAISLSSQALYDAFQHRWGFGTLGVSARFSAGDNYNDFVKFKKIMSAAAGGFRSKYSFKEIFRILVSPASYSHFFKRMGDFIYLFRRALLSWKS